MYLDIDRIKKEISIQSILSYYDIQLKRRNHHQLYGECPIHKGDNPNAFQVDTDKNLFHCFTHCGGGSIFDLVMKIENLTFYQAANKIWKVFYPDNTVNKMQLKLETNHPYLEKRKISPEIARYFQMGFCSTGIMKNRIAIPIIDESRNIVAYCGRSVYENGSAKYLFPRGFCKSNYLYNIQNILPDIRRHLFVVEGFFDSIHLVKMGFDSVALMGTTISKIQLQLLKKKNRNCVLMMDGDEAGAKGTKIISRLLRIYNIEFRSLWLQNNLDPESLDYDTILTILDN
jgi:DNA primase